MFSQLCSNLTTSLQYRDDLIEAMSKDMAHANETCNQTLFNSTSIIDNWWWDRKDQAFNRQDTCNSMVEQLKLEEEYGDISNVGIDLAL